MAVDAWGITDGYWSWDRERFDTPPETHAALLTAMGADDHPDGPPEPSPPMWIVTQGATDELWNPVDLRLEDGTVIEGVKALPPDLPLGYHELVPLDGWPSSRLVVAPPRAHAVGERSWGWAVQLYAARSRSSWGIGDLGDLARLAGWSSRLGARVLVLNPLHAVAPVHPQQPSPYYPASRMWKNPLALAIESMPGATSLGDDLARLANAGRALNDRRVIDRDAVFRLKRNAFDRLFTWWSTQAPQHERDEFAAFCAAHGGDLRLFAVYCALAERHGGGWPAWPPSYHSPKTGRVARFAREHKARVELHMWLQWQLDVQLARAAATGCKLVGDLAVGFDPGGADAWMWQDLLALDAHVGAPPDGFNVEGQDWGLPPFVPWKLRAAHFEPFIKTLRAAMRDVHGLRVDHVMGLYRLFWIPPGGSAKTGAYVHLPAREMLDLLALESARAGAFVVGEDLGTVEDEVREDLAARGILSYRLVWFEETEPERYPIQALAAVTTHDLPTLAGAWTGSDLEDQKRIGMTVSKSGADWFKSQLEKVTGFGPETDLERVVVAAHRALADAPSVVVAGTLDDALMVRERPNMPGTIDEWPNWSLALPRPLEEIEDDPVALSVAAALDAGRERGGA
jgi:4-alpha-glucanotransferase